MKQAKKYILTKWTSENFLLNDLKSVNSTNYNIIINKKFTFVERFLQKRKLRYIVFKLINDNLLLCSILKSGIYLLDFKKLFNSDYNIIQKEIQNLSEASKKTSNEIMKEIPDKYMNLLELEIFNNDLTLNSDLSKELWDEFAK